MRPAAAGLPVPIRTLAEPLPSAVSCGRHRGCTRASLRPGRISSRSCTPTQNGRARVGLRRTMELAEVLPQCPDTDGPDASLEPQR